MTENRNENEDDVEVVFPVNFGVDDCLVCDDGTKGTNNLRVGGAGKAIDIMICRDCASTYVTKHVAQGTSFEFLGVAFENANRRGLIPPEMIG